MRFNIGYVIGALLWLSYWICVCEAQPQLTSDIRAAPSVRLPDAPNIDPRGAPRFQPPMPFYFSFLHTNDRPLVIERTISSNVIRGEIWWNLNAWATNYDLKSSNVVSVTTVTVTTNTVSAP